MYYGGPVPWTCKANVVLADGFPIAVTGIAKHETRMRAFFDVAEGENADTVAIKRSIMDSMKYVYASRMEVFAFAEHEQGARLLKRLGFEHWQDGIYLWPS